MGCPVHIWAPLMAAAVPAARALRDRLGLYGPRRSGPDPPREDAPAVQRFEPVWQPRDGSRDA